MSGTILRRRDRTARSLRVVHYSSAVNKPPNTAISNSPAIVGRTMVSIPWLVPPRKHRRQDLKTD